jgi:hypothetical protein
VGARVQAEDRRHARGAGDHRGRGAPRRRGEGPRLRPGRHRGGGPALRRARRGLRRRTVRRRGRRGRAHARHRVERVPPARPRAPQDDHARAGGARRPERLGRREDAGGGVHVLRGRAERGRGG